MDTGTSVNQIAPFLLPGNLVIAAVGGGFLTAWGILRNRRQRSTWEKVAEEMDLTLRGAAGPHLSGIYRGRALDAGHEKNQLQVSVLTVNPAHLFDSILSHNVLPDTPWLRPESRETLCALRDIGRRWQIQVQGRLVTLVCFCSVASVTPELLRFLLDLSCDIAEGVDGVGSPRMASGIG